MAVRKSFLSAAVLTLIAAGASAPAIMDQFIQEKEGESLKAYQDGARVWTICNGKTAGVTRSTTMTKAECDAWRKTEIGRRLAFVHSVIKPEVSEPALAGIASWCLNVGDTGCAGSNAVSLINAGNQPAGCRAMLSWRFITRSMTIAEASAFAVKASNQADVKKRIGLAQSLGKQRVDVKVDCSDEQPWCKGLWQRRQAEAELCAL